MKNTYLLMVFAIVAIRHGNATAVGATCFTENYDVNGVCTSCQTVERVITCSANEIYCDCASCDALRTLTEKTITISASESYTIHECILNVAPIRPCKNCNSTDWGAHSTGYESRVNATCNHSTGVCTKTTVYRCAVGYYGNSTNGTSGCDSCPESGITSNAGATLITECYLASGTTGSDHTGMYTYAGDCYYVD